MTVAAEADWILDIGPEAGDGGGQIIVQAPPKKSPSPRAPGQHRFLKLPSVFEFHILIGYVANCIRLYSF